MRRRFRSLAIALLLVGCRPPATEVSSPRSDAAQLRTDRLTYVLEAKAAGRVLEQRAGQRGDPATAVPPVEARRTNRFEVRWPD